MGKTIGVLKDELNTIRAGRANASIDRIMVNYYELLHLLIKWLCIHTEPR